MSTRWSWLVLFVGIFFVGCGVAPEGEGLFETTRLSSRTEVATTGTLAQVQSAKSASLREGLQLPTRRLEPSYLRLRLPQKKLATVGQNAVSAYFGPRAGQLYVVRNVSSSLDATDTKIKLQEWNLNSKQPTKGREMGSSARKLFMYKVKQSADKRWLVMESHATGDIALWDLVKAYPELIERKSDTPYPHHGTVAFSRDGGVLYYHVNGEKNIQSIALTQRSRGVIPSQLASSFGDFGFMLDGRVAAVYNTCSRTPSLFRIGDNGPHKGIAERELLKQGGLGMYNDHQHLLSHPNDEAILLWNNGYSNKDGVRKELLLLSPQKGDIIWALKNITAFTWSHDGRFLITATKDQVRYWDWKSQKVIHTLHYQGIPSSVQVSQDGKMLAVAMKTPQNNYEVQVWSH